MLHYKDFFSKLYGVEGDYKEVLRLRDLFLNGKKTKHNKEERKQGYKLLTKNQKELHSARQAKNKSQSMMHVRAESNKKVANDYAEFLEKRRGASGKRKRENNV